jgi:hypothetical protein
MLPNDKKKKIDGKSTDIYTPLPLDSARSGTGGSLTGRYSSGAKDNVKQKAFIPKGAEGEASPIERESSNDFSVHMDSNKNGLFENSRDGSLSAEKMDGTCVKAKTNDFEFKEDEEGIRLKFKPYKEIIQNLTNMKLLETESDVVSCEMSNDSTRLLVVLKVSDEHFQVKQFCFKKFNCKFSYDLKADYIKAAKIL